MLTKSYQQTEFSLDLCPKTAEVLIYFALRIKYYTVRYEKYIQD